jgi:Arc/MetJ-type ribon-helix-helix transcriptional regulator
MNRRTKMISFRLLPEEYRALQQACRAQGVRNVSDLARTAIRRLITFSEQPRSLAQEVRDLRDNLRQISAELDRIAQRAEANKGDSKAQAN